MNPLLLCLGCEGLLFLIVAVFFIYIALTEEREK